MKSKAALVAAACAIVGVALMWLYMRQFERRTSGGELVEVLVARTDLQLGEQIDAATMLTPRAIPTAYLDRRQIRAAEVESVQGIRVIGGVQAGEVLLWTDLASGTDMSRDLSGLIRSGMRAVTIEADGSASFGGLLRAGDRVDVILTLDRPTAEGATERVTVPLLQGLLVLAAGQDMGARVVETAQETSRRRRPQMSSVTLSVTIEQAQLLTLARLRGEITLTLRNPQDPTITEPIDETTLSDLVTIEERQRVQRSRPRPPPPEASPTSMGPIRIGH